MLVGPCVVPRYRILPKTYTTKRAFCKKDCYCFFGEKYLSPTRLASSHPNLLEPGPPPSRRRRVVEADPAAPSVHELVPEPPVDVVHGRRAQASQSGVPRRRLLHLVRHRQRVAFLPPVVSSAPALVLLHWVHVEVARVGEVTLGVGSSLEWGCFGEMRR